MSTDTTLLSPELLAKLEKMELVSRKIFRGRMKGERRSRRKGQSVEFADFRNYVPGDDLRFIDRLQLERRRVAVELVNTRRVDVVALDREKELAGERRTHLQESGIAGAVLVGVELQLDARRVLDGPW